MVDPTPHSIYFAKHVIKGKRAQFTELLRCVQVNLEKEDYDSALYFLIPLEQNTKWIREQIEKAKQDSNARS